MKACVLIILTAPQKRKARVHIPFSKAGKRHNWYHPWQQQNRAPRADGEGQTTQRNALPFAKRYTKVHSVQWKLAPFTLEYFTPRSRPQAPLTDLLFTAHCISPCGYQKSLDVALREPDAFNASYGGDLLH
ncbi:hypothetical protein NDU88_005969 [Pleurodeles waltl]|uniref:Uncharacterized protein n=1 Tax=Pleurodeles waltl TaxID=8319 RepID=A0AAV7L5M2_PLEWA|nr:hypothetical protein NDU88_005969 [Pleurodeles waltl]